MSAQEEAPNYTKQSHLFYLGLPSRSHIGPTEFSGANMLPVPLRVDQLKLNHMYSILNGIAPSYLNPGTPYGTYMSHVFFLHLLQ